uniref:NUP50 domain-containing protein n=1 Tax=Steinernema glaseri TaxID=37863 RepID=A0A1I7YSK8_9BILA
MRQNHLAKGTKYGLEQSVQYMDSIVDTYEDAIVNHHDSLNNVENFIKSRLAALDGKTQSLNVESALQQHCTRFEMLFRRSASKIFENDEKVKRVKADFLSVRRRKYGQHAKDPFKSAASKSVLDNKENLPLLKADQTFPSQTTLMRIGQSVPRTAPVAGPTVGFGANTATGSLFGSAAKPAVAPFSFATGATSTASTAGSLFNKPFGTTTTTTTAPSSLFGPTTSTATTTTASAFPFGNTLNSSVSGTLFGGSASKPFGK